jgi:hypothetical protein
MENNKMKWMELIHLGSNLWHEEGNRKGREHRSTPEAPLFCFLTASVGISIPKICAKPVLIHSLSILQRL